MSFSNHLLATVFNLMERFVQIIFFIKLPLFWIYLFFKFPFYKQGVALYAIIGFIGALVVILGTILYIIFFCGFDYCCVTSCCKRKAFLPKQQRQICALTVLTLFFAFLVTVIILCYTNGIAVVFDGVAETADAPSGFATVTYRMSTALMPTFVAMMGSVALPTLRDLNTTVNSAISYEAIVDDLEALNATVGRLPNIKKIIHALDTIDAGVDQLTSDINGVNQDYADYQTAKTNINDATYVCLSDLRRLNASLEWISGNVTVGEAVVADLADLYVDLFGAAGPNSYNSSDTDGILDKSQHDVRLATRSDTPGEGFPLEVTLADAATGPYASLAQLVSNNLNADPTEIDALNTKLHGIYDSVLKLPNFTTTAIRLVSLNETIEGVLASDGLINNMEVFLHALEDSINTLPNVTLIAEHAQTLYDYTQDLNTDSIYGHVSSIDDTVDELATELDIIIVEVQKIRGVLLSVLPPLYNLLVVQVEGFNRTIMDTPYDTRKLFDRLNETVYDTLTNTDEFLPDLDTASADLVDNLDIPYYLGVILDLQDQLDGASGSADDLEVFKSLNVDNNFDVANAITELNEVRDALNDVSIDISPAGVGSFRRLEELRWGTETRLRRLVARINDVGSDGTISLVEGDYWLLGKGMCSTDLAAYCTTNAECPSNGPCVGLGVYRCTHDGNVIVPCARDSDCSGGAYCLNDFDRATELGTLLTAMADPTLFNDVSGLETSFNDFRTIAQSLDPAEVKSDMSDVQDDIDDNNTIEYERELEEIPDQINAVDVDFQDILDLVDESLDKLNEIDTEQYSDDLNEIQKQLDNGADKLSEYVTLAKDLKRYIFKENGLNERMESLETTRMQASMDERGFGQTLMYTGQAIENTIDDVLAIMKNNTFDQKRIEITNEMRDAARYLDRATGNEHVGFVDIHYAGSFYYLLQMSNASADMSVDARDPTQKLVMTDINGDRYPDDKYCVTRYCFENQQQELEDDYGMYLPLLLIPLAVVCLIAIANVLCLIHPKDNRNEKLCCSRFLMCFIIVIVPWYLIFSGFVFAFTIAASDGCTSGPKIAANYVRAYGDDLCIRLDGKGTLTECNFKGNGFDVTIDIQAMTDAILGTGTCEGGADKDPFYVPLHSLSEQLQSETDAQVDRQMNKKDLRDVRQPVKSLIKNSARRGATVASDFIDTVGLEVLTCENLSRMLGAFKEPVCYTSVGAGAWLVSCLYLAAWCMCCLGIPAACALKNHYRLTILEEIEEKLSNKKAVSKEFMHNFMIAKRRGRGVLGRKFKPVANFTDFDESDTEDGSGDGSSGGAGFGGGESKGDDVGARSVAYSAESGGPSHKGGFFAKYPRVKSNNNTAYANTADENKQDEAESESDGEEEVVAGDPVEPTPGRGVLNIDSYRSEDNAV